MEEDELPPKTSDATIVDIETVRADRLLDFLRADPFIAIVVSGDRVRIYARADLTKRHMREIQEALADLIEGD